MTGEAELYLTLLEEQRQAVRDALLGLDADGLNWLPPAQDTHSIYNLGQHVAWVEQWWIGTVLGGRPFVHDWSQNQDLTGSGEDAADLLFWLDEAATTTRAVLKTLAPGELDAVRSVPRSSGSEDHLPSRWLVLHTIQHYAEHIGQMLLTRQLWDAARPGLPAERQG